MKRITLWNFTIFWALLWCAAAPGELYSQQVQELPTGWAGVYYDYQLTHTGLLEQQWELVSGSLPPGLKLEPWGRVHGLPSGPEGGDYRFTAVVKGQDQQKQSAGVSQVTYHVGLTISDFPYWSRGENFRVILGYEQSGGCSLDSSQGAFVDLYLSKPLPLWFNRSKPSDHMVGRPLRIWGNIRITSVPREIQTTAAEFTTGFSGLLNVFTQEGFMKAAEFLAGLDYCLFNIKGKGRVGYSLSVMAGYGVITPTSAHESIQLFRVSPAAVDYFPGQDFEGKEYIAFVQSERSRFYRQYYGGVRLKTYFKPEVVIQKDTRDGGNVSRTVQTRFPAMLDVLFGYNESITPDGPWRGVIRLEGFMPLRVSHWATVYLFGTLLLKTTPTEVRTPLFLEPAPPNTPFPAANILYLSNPQVNRDFYRIGIGVDLTGFFLR